MRCWIVMPPAPSAPARPRRPQPRHLAPVRHLLALTLRASGKARRRESSSARSGEMGSGAMTAPVAAFDAACSWRNSLRWPERGPLPRATGGIRPLVRERRDDLALPRQVFAGKWDSAFRALADDVTLNIRSGKVCVVYRVGSTFVPDGDALRYVSEGALSEIIHEIDHRSVEIDSIFSLRPDKEALTSVASLNVHTIAGSQYLGAI